MTRGEGTDSEGAWAGEVPQEEMNVKGTLKQVAVGAAVLALGCLGAAAASTPSLPNVAPGEAYLRSDIWKNVDSEITPLPGVIAQTEASGPSTVVPHQAGPVALGLTSKGALTPTASFGASSIPGTSAGSFLTPQERTTNEIRKAIRRLG